MSTPILKVLSAGSGASIQDGGRSGWKRYGVPTGGAMDSDSAEWANKLVGNDPSSPVLEILMSGTRLRFARDCMAAITGAEIDTGFPRWRSFPVKAGQELLFGRRDAGVWSYLAIEGGLAADRWLGSASVNARAGFGRNLKPGDTLSRARTPDPTAIASRFRPDHPLLASQPDFAIWPGPEEAVFSEETRTLFMQSPWTISPKSDRTGYRLEGPVLPTDGTQIVSSPLVIGTIQLPPDGKPIVILRDGPTVGGYPRIAVLEPGAISRFTQCAPGETIRFKPAGTHGY